MRERVEELVERDRLPRRPPLLEVVALQDPRDGHAGREPYESFGAERGQPGAVELDGGLLRIEDPEGLSRIRRGVRLDLRPRQLGPRGLAAGGVADHGREIPDDEDDAVAGVLEVLHLPEDDGVPEVNVGRRGIEADLDGQAATLDPPRELVLLDQVDGAPPQELEFRRSGSHCGPE